MLSPTLSDPDLDKLLEEVRQKKMLPSGVVWAGEANDGYILDIAVESSGSELCIRNKPEKAIGRKWELVRPLFGGQ